MDGKIFGPKWLEPKNSADDDDDDDNDDDDGDDDDNFTLFYF